jgi:protein ImuB
MLWLALWLPDLPLAACAARPLAAVVVARGQVVAADEVAGAAGIVPGMRMATARGLLPEIAILPRDTAREAALIEEIACWAARFTPIISLAPPAALLLEIGGSLRLFGGVGPLFDALGRGCAQCGLKPQIGVAPTPLAALWLARSADSDGTAPVVEKRETLAEVLAPLLIAVIEASPDIAERLAAFGVRRLGDLFALPRAGLARRLGRAFVEQIEQALGERPDPRPQFTFPAQFALRLELPQPVGEASALLFVARRLVEALCGWLAQRQAGVTACTLFFEHGRSLRHAADSRLDLRCASATRTPERLIRILRERLECTRLVAPVQAVKLSAEACEALPGRSIDLFDMARTGVADDVLAGLVERLRARLGDHAVHGLMPVADYRPECATRPASPLGPPVAIVSAPARPLWLLAAPEVLPEIGGHPHRHGAALELLAGPEHIAAGWWDAGEHSSDPRAPQYSLEALGDVRRDYFIARSAQHECFWIFRDHAGWFLHGVFA